MGFSFTNLQIRYHEKLDDAALDALAERIAGEGALKMVNTREEADVVTAIYQPEGAAWITVVSDLFDADVEKQTALAKSISQEYGVPALTVSCYDSDFLMLNWLDESRGHDLFATTGSAAEAGLKGMRRSNFAAWRKVLPDAEAFKQAMRRDRIFAEECMADVADMLALPVHQGQACLELLDELPGVKLYYYKAPAAQAEPPRFVYYSSSFQLRTGDNWVEFYNAGGDTRGVTVLLAGEDLVSGALSVTRVEFKYMKRGRWYSYDPVPAERTVFRDGVVRFRAEMPDLRVRRVPEDMPSLKQQKLIGERGFHVSVTLTPRDTERTDYAPVTAYLIPSRHWEGQCARVLDICYPVRVEPPFVFPLYFPSQVPENML